jgi:hypothetical protein
LFITNGKTEFASGCIHALIGLCCKLHKDYYFSILNLSMTFNFYCDESCHLENDGQSHMLIAYTSCSYNQVKIFHEGIKAIKKKHIFCHEIKWSSVSKAKYPFYAELIDYFFSNDLNFRATVVSKEKVKNQAFGQSFDDFYYKMYYQLLHHKIDMNNTYNIYLDIKDTLSAKKVQKLKEIVNIQYNSIRTIQNIRSHESLLMQLTDLLMGAVSYNLRGLTTKNNVIAKQNLIDKIKQHSKLNLEQSTSKIHEKFNLFFIDLK